MMDVRARLAPGGAVSAADLAALVSVPISGEPFFDEDGLLVVPFANDLTTTEQQAVEDRIASRNTVEESLRTQARGALDGNRTFIGTTAGQLTAGADAILANTASCQQERDLAKAVKALTSQTTALARQNVKLIRLTLGMLDGLD